MRLGWLAVFVVWLGVSCGAFAQAGDLSYSRLNSFSGFGEYSNDSSHIILGEALNRKIGAIGIQYQRRLIHKRLLDFSYTAEFRPVILESDPTQTITITVTTTSPPNVNQGLNYAVVVCHPGTYSFDNGSGYSANEVVTCGRRLVYAQGLAPVGFRVNGMTRHKLQPTFSVLGGYIYSPQVVPTNAFGVLSGSFNFTVEFGAGLELYRSARRSMRLEYQVQHYSNGYTADANPGVDSGFIKFTYAFGR
jgi:Lipid A 3-O-deacylase (PagL)